VTAGYAEHKESGYSNMRQRKTSQIITTWSHHNLQR